jgi:hypothetical protein
MIPKQGQPSTKWLSVKKLTGSGYRERTDYENEGKMSENLSISIGRCEIEFIPGAKPSLGKPTSQRKDFREQVAQLTTFRITSSDELNLMVGLYIWEEAAPEVRPIDLLGGLQKHNELKGRGGISLTISQGGKWLVPLRVLKYSASKGYFTLQGASEEELDEILGHSFRELMMDLGAIKFGPRESIDQETNNKRNQLAMIVEPGNLEAIAVAYAVTRAQAVILDFGLDAS